MSEIFNTLLVYPIINVLLVFYHILATLHLPYALGFAIIFLTVFIRLLLYPLVTSQLKASKKMQDLAPHISRVRAKHKGDAKRLQEETMKLYKEHGINPAAGCLPLLVQMPIIWALYSVLQKIVSLNGQSIISHVNEIAYVEVLRLSQPWDQHFFGMPLGQNPSQLIGDMPLILMVPLLTAVFQFAQSKMMIVSPVAPETEKKGEMDFASAFQTQSLYIFPVMIGFLSYTFPIGLSLYWNTFTIFGILQQYKIQGLGGLAQWLEKLKKQ